jgi:ABC-2 type transport system ATP-binding protein
VGEVLDLVGLEHRARVRIRQLSGGEKRRLHLGLAVMADPEVLFLDEPTAGLDAESRRDTWTLVRGLLADGHTVLLTTHYLAEVEELADRLAILHQGRIVRAGSPAEVAAGEPATVSFRLPPGRPGIELPELPGVISSERHEHPAGPRLALRSRDPQATLAALLQWAEPRGLALIDLTSRPASLEEAFLAVAA